LKSCAAYQFSLQLGRDLPVSLDLPILPPAGKDFRMSCYSLDLSPAGNKYSASHYPPIVFPAGNLPWSVPRPTLECSATYPGVFCDLPWSVPRPTLECSATYPGVFRDLPVCSPAGRRSSRLILPTNSLSCWDLTFCVLRATSTLFSRGRML